MPDMTTLTLPTGLLPTILDALQVRLDETPAVDTRERADLEMLIAEMDDPGVVDWEG